jgi:hypothetical protein
LKALQTPGLRLVVPTLCIAEAAYFIGLKGRASAEAQFLRVDASVVVLAERLRTDLIVTLDHRHFRVVRPEHFDAFRLLPANVH